MAAGSLVSKNLIVGISVGNEDFYRQSLKGTPMAASQGSGSKASVIMKQINQVRQKLAQQTPSLLDKIPVGHSDTRSTASIFLRRDDYGAGA